MSRTIGVLLVVLLEWGEGKGAKSKEQLGIRREQ